MKLPELFDLSKELCRRAQRHAWVTVIAVRGPSSAYVGAQAIVDDEGCIHGWIGGGCVQGAARAAALRALSTSLPQRLRLSNSGDANEDADVYPMSCASNGEVELFIQPAAVALRLRVYGNTPLARAAAWLARETDFDPLTDAEAADAESMAAALRPSLNAAPAEAAARETYALIATQGDGDEAALEAALRSNARAILLVASKRKAARLRTAMTMRGIAEDRLAAIHAPAGPDIGAVTPNEIALAAVAGLIALRRSQLRSTGAAADGPHAQAMEQAARASSTQSNLTGYVNPVCGAVVDPARAVSSVSMEGQTHYFCCRGCRDEFDRDPHKYLAIAAHLRAPASAAISVPQESAAAAAAAAPGDVT